MPEINPIQGLKLLSEATVDSLSELFNRDPLTYTHEDRVRFVSELRALRARWAVAEMAGKKSLPKVDKPKVEKSTAVAAPKDMDF
jgi:hypothetical protein